MSREGPDFWRSDRCAANIGNLDSSSITPAAEQHRKGARNQIRRGPRFRALYLLSPVESSLTRMLLCQVALFAGECVPVRPGPAQKPQFRTIKEVRQDAAAPLVKGKRTFVRVVADVPFVDDVMSRRKHRFFFGLQCVADVLPKRRLSLSRRHFVQVN